MRSLRRPGDSRPKKRDVAIAIENHDRWKHVDLSLVEHEPLGIDQHRVGVGLVLNEVADRLGVFANTDRKKLDASALVLLIDHVEEPGLNVARSTTRSPRKSTTTTSPSSVSGPTSSPSRVSSENPERMAGYSSAPTLGERAFERPTVHPNEAASAARTTTAVPKTTPRARLVGVKTIAQDYTDRSTIQVHEKTNAMSQPGHRVHMEKRG